ncbi:MAG TPA: hypothetical protein IGR64_04095 [Leptolyngbyaceae cyanobacterium M65_K2018_010]|nr:hypothetical protein [Leptolyngbyaceae cyanobacterium M65_K2018_010]
MNAPANSTEFSLPIAPSPASLPQTDARETAPAANDAICWIEVRQSPYAPDHQVELLHLQAEAEALLLQLQTLQQKRCNGQA